MGDSHRRRRSMALIQAHLQSSQESVNSEDYVPTSPSSTTISNKKKSLTASINGRDTVPGLTSFRFDRSSSSLGQKNRRNSVSSIQSHRSHRSQTSNISVRELFAQANDPSSLLTTAGIVPTADDEEKIAKLEREAHINRQNKRFMDGLLKTSMHLIDEKDQYLNNVENLLLPLLDSLLSSGAVKQGSELSKQLIDAHNWSLRQFHDGGVSLPGASRYDVRLCGWLGKLGRGQTKIQKRWIELSGQTLSYFADEKNGLELRGCLDLDGCLCRPLPPTKSGLSSFELRAGGSNKVIKKINNTMKKGKYKEKSCYKFSVSNDNDLHMWTVAIQEAINQPELRRVKRTCKEITDICNIQNAEERIDKYCRKLKSMAGDRWLRFPCDWLHQQVLMKSAKEKGEEVGGPVIDDRHQAKNLAQVYKDVVRDVIVIDGKEFVCASGDIIIQSLFSQIYDIFRRQHQIGSENQPDENRSGEGGLGNGSNKNNNDEFNVERDHFITKNALAYTRAVLLAGCRTVSGGDTYDAVDFMLRDSNICVICPDSEFVAPVRIEVLYEDYGDDLIDISSSSRSDAPKGRRSAPTTSVSGFKKHQRAASDGHILSPFSTKMKNANTEDVLHVASVNVLSNSGDKSDQYFSAKSSPVLRTDSRQSKLQGLRERFRSPEETLNKANSSSSLFGNDNITSTSSNNKNKESMDMSPEELEILEAMAWPTVRVEVDSRYRIMDSDPMSGRSDDPLLAKVQTKFTRAFAWGRHTYCKPAEVLVKILPNDEEEEEDDSEDDSKLFSPNRRRGSSLLL